MYQDDARGLKETRSALRRVRIYPKLENESSRATRFGLEVPVRLSTTRRKELVIANQSQSYRIGRRQNRRGTAS